MQSSHCCLGLLYFKCLTTLYESAALQMSRNYIGVLLKFFTCFWKTSAFPDSAHSAQLSKCSKMVSVLIVSRWSQDNELAERITSNSFLLAPTNHDPQAKLVVSQTQFYLQMLQTLYFYLRWVLERAPERIFGWCFTEQNPQLLALRC